MIELISSLKGALAMTGASVGGGLVTMGVADVIGDDTSVKIGLVGGLIVAVFYAGATFRGMKDDVKTLKVDMKEVKQVVKNLQTENDASRDHHAQKCPLINSRECPEIQA